MSGSEGPGWSLLRGLLFLWDPEAVHDVGLGALEALAASPSAQGLVACGAPEDARLETTVFGLRFPNPLGLAAGFDKDARAIDALAALGFGAVEVGTVTPRPQPGNDRPRLFRLPADRALVNRLGFNSAGARAAAAHLAARLPVPARRAVVGLNLGKNRATPLADAAADYELALRRLGRGGDYLAVNVSSPNTPGLRDLQAGSSLRGIVETVVRTERELAGVAASAARPVLVKLAPDLDDASLDASLDAAAEAGAAGFLAANTTVGRPASLAPAPAVHEAGGLSGAPLHARALEVVTRAFRRFDGRLPVVGVGGVSDGERAWRLLRAGASLVQVYTGFVYGGPGFPRRVLRTLIARVEAAGLASIADAVGADA